MDVILADIDDVFLGWAAEQLDSATPVQTHATLDDATEAARALGQPCTLLLGPNLDPDEAIAAIRVLDAEAPQVACVFVAASPDPQLLTDALRAGVEDVLTYPFNSDELVEAVKRASARSVRVAPSRDVSEPSQPVTLGKVTTVFSTKGGSGKSLVATNLALLMQRESGGQVALVDLDLQSGDVAILLDLAAERSMVDATERAESLDADALEGYLTSHSSGIRVLTAPTDPSLAEGISADAVHRVLTILRERFDHVIIDGPAQFTEQVLAAFDVTDTFVLLASLDVPSIKNLRVALNTLDQLGVSRDRVRICVNRANTKVGLSLKDVRKALGTEIHITIPSSRDVPLSYNAAAPLALEQPRNEVVLAIAELLPHLGVAMADTTARPRRRLFG